MKKLIALALSIALGSAGYTIVDKKLESRVAALEKSVSSLVELSNANPSQSLTSAKGTSETQEHLLKTDINYCYGYYNLILPEINNYYDCYVLGMEDNYNPNWVYKIAYLNSDEKSFKIKFSLFKNSQKNVKIYVNEILYFSCALISDDENLYIANVKYYKTEINSDELSTTVTTVPAPTEIREASTTQIGEVTTADFDFTTKTTNDDSIQKTFVYYGDD